MAAAAAAARAAEQDRLLAEAAAAMHAGGAGAGAGAAAAYTPKQLNAFRVLGIEPTRNATTIRRAYHALLPNVRAAFTTIGGNNAAVRAARNRLATLQAAYETLK